MFDKNVRLASRTSHGLFGVDPSLDSSPLIILTGYVMFLVDPSIHKLETSVLPKILGREQCPTPFSSSFPLYMIDEIPECNWNLLLSSCWTPCYPFFQNLLAYHIIFSVLQYSQPPTTSSTYIRRLWMTECSFCDWWNNGLLHRPI